MSKRPSDSESRAVGKRRADAEYLQDTAVDEDLQEALLSFDDGDVDALNHGAAEADLASGVPADTTDVLEVGLEGVTAHNNVEDDLELPIDPGELETATDINLSAVNLTAAQARRIAPLLCSNAELVTIRFQGHDLSVSDLKEEDELEWDSEEYSDVEAIIIAEFLKSNRALKRLDLARNHVSDDGAIALALALKENATLEYLNLESNVVAEQGGKALSEAVQTNNTLQYLNLMHNAIPSSGQQELRDVWAKVREGRQLGLHL
jgi:hypothetical protein